MEQEWQNPEIFEMYEGGRSIVRDATQKVIKEIFEKNISPDGVIVELGSGIGELSKIAPEKYKNKFIEIEGTERFSRIRKEKDEKALAVTADINALPVLSESADTVVSYSAFDTLPVLNTAISEVKRVLKKGGKFINLLDLQPNVLILMNELPPDVIPFPNIVNRIVNGFQLVKKADYEKLKKEMNPAVIPMFDLYANDPMYSLGFMSQNGMQDILVHMAGEVKNASIEKTVTPTLKESFGEKMIRELTANGFKIIKVEDVSAEDSVPANDSHKKMPEYNYFENNVGSIYAKYRAELATELPPGYVKEKSTLFSIIAEKT